MKKLRYPSLAGKRIAISGSTGGIGGELCRHIASLGGEVICLDRNEKKARALIDRIKKEYPDARLRHEYMDLEELDSVDGAAKRLTELDTDVLILCAGAYHIPRKRCKSGHDNVYQINFLAPYRLSELMKPYLESRGGRLVAVGSLSQAVARLDPDDPEALSARPAAAYGSAKLRLMLSLSSLCGEGDLLSLAHPGISPTGITNGYPPLIRALIKYPMKLIFMSPKRAAVCILHGVFVPTPRGYWISPRLFGVRGAPTVTKMIGYAEGDGFGLEKDG